MLIAELVRTWYNVPYLQMLYGQCVEISTLLTECNVGFEADVLSFFPEQFFVTFCVYNQLSTPPMPSKSVEIISIIDFSHLCKSAGF